MNKGELVEKLEKLKRGYCRETRLGLEMAKQEVEKLDEPEITEEQTLDYIADTLPLSKADVSHHLGKLVAHGGKVTYGEWEPLTEEWIDDNKEMYLINDTSENAVPDYKLRNLLVPKQEERKWDESEETEVKDKKWLRDSITKVMQDLFSTSNPNYFDFEKANKQMRELVDQLDEPEVLSQEITEEQAYDKIAESFPATGKEIESVLEKYYSSMLIEFSEELHESIMRAFDVEETSKTIEALTSMTLEQIAEEARNGGIVPKEEEITEEQVQKYLSEHGIGVVELPVIPIQLQSNHYLDILNEMKEIHEAKNADYGSSFDKSLEEDGLLSAKIRMKDKLNRFSQLIEHKANVVDESLEDTLIDLANYAVMTVAYIRKQEDDQQGKQHPRITAKNVIDTYYNGVNLND